MNRTTWLGLVLLVGFAALFDARQAAGAPPNPLTRPPVRNHGFTSPLPAPPLGQPDSPLAYPEPASPVVVDADSPDCVGVAGLDGYRMVSRRAIVPMPVNGAIERYSLRPSISELRFFVTRTEGQGCNLHRANTVVDPQTGARSVTDESYAVDDLFFSYCKACPLPGSGSWQVNKRTPGVERSSTPLGLTPTAVGPLAVQRLVAQSSVVGDEAMNGFATVHRRFTDQGALAEAVRWELGGSPQNPLAVTTAQLDMWLTRDTHRLVRLLFQAEGKAQGITQAGVLHPFALKDEFNLTPVARNTPLVVPSAILAAVAPQRKALAGE